MNSHGKSSDEASPQPLSDEARSLAAVTVKVETVCAESEATRYKPSECHSNDLSLLIRDLIHRKAKDGLGTTMADLVGEISEYFLGLVNDYNDYFKDMMEIRKLIRYHLRRLGALCFEQEKWFLVNDTPPDPEVVKSIRRNAKVAVRRLEQPDRRTRGSREMPAGKLKASEVLGLPVWKCPHGYGPTEFLMAILARLKNVSETLPVEGDEAYVLRRGDPARENGLPLLVRDVLANSDGASLTLLVNQILPYFLGLKNSRGKSFDMSLCPIEVTLQCLYLLGAKCIDGLWYLSDDAALDAAAVGLTKATALARQNPCSAQTGILPDSETGHIIENGTDISPAAAMGTLTYVDGGLQLEYSEVEVELHRTKKPTAAKKRTKQTERQKKRAVQRSTTSTLTKAPRTPAKRNTMTSKRATLHSVPCPVTVIPEVIDISSDDNQEEISIRSTSSSSSDETRAIGPIVEIEDDLPKDTPPLGVRLLLAEEQNVRSSAQYKQFVHFVLQERTMAALIRAIAARYSIEADDITDVSLIDSKQNVLVLIDLDSQVAALTPNAMLAVRRKPR